MSRQSSLGVGERCIVFCNKPFIFVIGLFIPFSLGSFNVSNGRTQKFICKQWFTLRPFFYQNLAKLECSQKFMDLPSPLVRTALKLSLYCWKKEGFMCSVPDVAWRSSFIECKKTILGSHCYRMSNWANREPSVDAFFICISAILRIQLFQEKRSVIIYFVWMWKCNAINLFTTHYNYHYTVRKKKTINCIHPSRRKYFILLQLWNQMSKSKRGACIESNNQIKLQY